MLQQCWGSFPKISAPWVDIINLLLRITTHQQQLNLLLQALKPTWTHLPSRNGAPLGRSLLGSVVCGGLGFTPTLHMLCPAPHKPTLQDKGPENPLLNGFPSAPGQKGYLADFAMEGNISQALKKLRL